MSTLRVSSPKDLLHERLRSNVLECLGGQREAVDLPGLPALLDAVVDERHETGGHDDTGDGRKDTRLVYIFPIYSRLGRAK